MTIRKTVASDEFIYGKGLFNYKRSVRCKVCVCVCVSVCVCVALCPLCYKSPVITHAITQQPLLYGDFVT